jgi:hypothetical protein
LNAHQLFTKEVMMPKKIQITKLDIARWISILPLTILAILLYIKIILDSLYRFLPLFFGIEVTNSILNIFNALLIPIIITACAYLVSPKFKFKSTFVIVIIFICLHGLRYVDSTYGRENFISFMPLYAVSYLLSLFVAYRIEKK